MTKIKTLLLLSCALSCLFFACGKKEDVKVHLPPATQTGAHTMGYMVDGRGYISTWRSADPNNLMGFRISYMPGNPWISFGDNTMHLSFLCDAKTGTYPLGGNNAIISRFFDFNYRDSQGPGSHIFETDSIRRGEITITRFDSDILSGTFWFDGVNTAGITRQIRDGRFDIRLRP